MSKQPLVPQEVIITIGDRKFTQTPFGLDRTARLFGLMSKIMGRARSFPELFELFNQFEKSPVTPEEPVKEDDETDAKFKARVKEYEEKLAEFESEREEAEIKSLRMMAQVLEVMFMVLPDSLLELVMLCLDIQNDQEAQDYVKKHGSPSQMMQIIGHMVDQNDMKGVWKDFLALQSRLTKMFQKN